MTRPCDGCDNPPDNRRWMDNNGTSLCKGCVDRVAAPRIRLEAAIRRFTVEAKDAAGELVPNGSKGEQSLVFLTEHPYIFGAPLDVAQAFVEAMTARGDDCQELREAAEAFFGGDFRAAKRGAT